MEINDQELQVEFTLALKTLCTAEKLISDVRSKFIWMDDATPSVARDLITERLEDGRAELRIAVVSIGTAWAEHNRFVHGWKPSV